MTRRLLFSYLGLAILILLILELPLGTLAQRFERDLATNQAEREANGLVTLAGDDMADGNAAQLQGIVRDYQARTGGEVIVASPSGAVVAASSDDAQNDAVGDMGPLLRQALAGQAATAFTTDENKPFAVAAVPISLDGRTQGAVVLATPAGYSERRIHEIWLALAAFAGVALVVVAGVGMMLARSLTLPLAHLEAAVERLGDGDLSSRAGADQGPREIRSLARQFNLMADRLDELVEAQQRFVADASHQLRSPLTALRLRIENLEAVADERTGGSIAAVGRELHRMSRIVDGLLTLGRAGQEQPATAAVDVGEVITERCQAWSALAAERGVELAVGPLPSRDGRSRLIPGDLEQILDNLIANAVEVSPNGATIEVALLHRAGNHEIHVLDHGPGMTESDRVRAFDRFWQSPDRSTGHSGLGLAIVRQLALRNGLSVELQAARPHGVDAVVQLP